MAVEYVVVDVETTGNSFQKGAKIIQISAVVVKHGRIVDQFTSFINPGHPIPPFIKELTGIYEDDVAQAPKFSDLADEIFHLLEGAVFVAHNVKFDRSFIAGELKEAGFSNPIVQTLDTVELANILLPEAESYKLGELSDQMELEHDHPHQADSDALATAELFIQLLEKTRKLPLATLEMLKQLAKKLNNSLFYFFDSIWQEKSREWELLPDHLEQFRGIVLKKKELPALEARVHPPVYPKGRQEKSRLLEQSFGQFEMRSGQLEMMDTVYESFTCDIHAVIEAGTGIGKSIGYLLPSVYFAAAAQEKVMISTYTIQLEHQLLEKEVNILSKALPFSFQAALIKGREHYINMFKFEQTLREKESAYDETITKMKILIWLLYTETGDIAELNLSSGGKLFCKRICNDRTMIQQNDPWSSRDFYLHSRKLASQADIIITNHAMLVADMEHEGLPPCDRIVIDEAHHLEKVVRTKLGQVLDYNKIKFLIGKLGTSDKKKQLSRLNHCISRLGELPEIHTFLLDQYISDLEAETDDLFSMLGQLIKKGKSGRSNSKRQKLRITDSVRTSRSWFHIQVCAERFLDFHNRISKGILERLKFINKHQTMLPPSDLAFMEEMTTFWNQWENIQRQIDPLISGSDSKEVIWLESDQTYLPMRTSVHRQPLHIDWFLSEQLFAKKKSIVLTSASLAANQSFAYFNRETGIDSFNRIEKAIDSPFPYGERVKMFIPTDLPQISTTPMTEFAEIISCHLAAIADAAEGRMLVLFTSYELLKTTYELLQDSNALEDFLLLADGVSSGSRNRLVKSFQQFKKAILFGSGSFWEGIDIPGDDLSCLVVVRLPFSPIDEPLTAAKMDAVKSSGRNPFSAYSLPEAIIQFKQGFGRLIRKQTDRGVFFVFDQRILTSAYGRAFIRSIPPVQYEKGPIEQLIPSVENWLEKK
ncbi:ATP-dependent DNA helicase DinG [Siminovitchia sediminis]|uniref:3'-5' exonuclease DinG n=1 Tax=Siminovitchia sediminis TaxID=1274353 RepID=A0ABW4KK46_9BACI